MIDSGNQTMTVTDSCFCNLSEEAGLMNSTAMRSRSMIVAALLCKLRTSSFNEITISEIAASAGVSRKTFYKNFHGKQDVIDEYICELVDQYLAQAKQLGFVDFRDLLIHYFTFWNASAPTLRVLQRNNLLGSVLDVQTRRLIELLPLQPLPWHDGELGDEKHIDLLMIGGLWNILRFHLQHGDAIKPAALSDEIIASLSLRTAVALPARL